MSVYSPAASLAQRLPFPAQHRANFVHLILDIGWFGVLNGSAISFLAVYASRLGASAFQIGILSAAPALVNLAVALPAGRWLQGRPIDRGVFWTSVLHRAFYLPWVFLPLLFAEQGQIWALVALVIMMSIPGTALVILILSINLLGDGVRDVTAPENRN